MIEVRRTGDGDLLEFEAVVREGEGEARHHVTMAPEVRDRLTSGKHTPEECLEAAFRFLLDPEPNESILSRFDATVISRYFPNRTGAAALLGAVLIRGGSTVAGPSILGLMSPWVSLLISAARKDSSVGLELKSCMVWLPVPVLGEDAGGACTGPRQAATLKTFF